MKKRIISAMLVLVMTFAMIPITAQAATYGPYTYKVEDGLATITDVDESISGDVVMPNAFVVEGLGEYPIVAIYDDAFLQCANIESLVLPEGLQSIGASAFWGCTNLKSIVMADNVEYIGACAFTECTSLKDIRWSSKLLTIEGAAFQTCTSLETVTLPSSLTWLGTGVFTGCESLKYIVIGKNTEFEFDWSDGTIFSYCPNITHFVCYDGSPAEEYAEQEGLLVKYLYDKMEDPTTGVSIATDEMLTLEQGDTFEASAIPDYTFNGLEDIIAAYDFQYLKNGEPPKTPFNVTATIPTPEGYDSEFCKVYFIKDGQILAEMPVTANENALAFPTDCNPGIYVVVSTEPPTPRLPGDATADGIVNLKDVVTLIRHLAGYNVTLDEELADVTGDDTVNLKDVVTLIRHLSGYPVELV